MVFKDVTQSSLTSSSQLSFIYKQDPTIQPSAGSNLDAARTNAFYLVNTVHDIMYR